MESLEFTLATVVGKMASCEFYAAIYANRLSISLESATTTQAMTERLGGALNDMYEAIRDFTLQAKEYFGDSKLPSKTLYSSFFTLKSMFNANLLINNSVSIKIKNLFTPFAVKMKPAIEAIADKEKIIRELADMATMERMMGMDLNISNAFIFLQVNRQSSN